MYCKYKCMWLDFKENMLGRLKVNRNDAGALNALCLMNRMEIEAERNLSKEKAPAGTAIPDAGTQLKNQFKDTI